MTTVLVLGGARSGKTRYALKTAEGRPGPLVMVATAEAHDAEMTERIQRHQAERGPRWRTIEAPLDLAVALSSVARGETVVVDCLTLWLSNLMHARLDIGAALDALEVSMSGAEVVLVSNEVGLGLVPETALGRRFRDEAGWMNQRLAAACDRVVFVAAGLPLVLKGAIGGA